MRYLADWQEYLIAVEGLAPATAAKYGDFVRMLGADGDDPAALTFERLERFLKDLFTRGYAGSSRAIAVVAIKNFCRYLCARSVLAKNPAVTLRRPRVYRRERPTLTQAEVQRLVYGARSGIAPAEPLELRNRCLLYTTYILGLRPGEPGRLRLDELEWLPGKEGKVYTVLLSRGKAQSSDVRKPLDLDGSRLIAFYLRERPRIEHPWLQRGRVVSLRPGPTAAGASPWLFPSSTGGMLSRLAVYDLFRARLKASGIEVGSRKLTPHCLRHSIATHLLRVGWDVKEVQRFMRHRSIETTGEYLHADEEKQAALLTRLHPIHAAGRRERPDLPAALEALREDLST